MKMKLRNKNKKFVDEILRIFSDSDFDCIEDCVYLWSNVEEVSAKAFATDLKGLGSIYHYHDTFNSVEGYSEKGRDVDIYEYFSKEETSYCEKEEIIWKYFLDLDWEFEGEHIKNLIRDL